MNNEICFDCYRIMEKTEESNEDIRREYWVCKSCGKRKDNQIE